MSGFQTERRLLTADPVSGVLLFRSMSDFDWLNFLPTAIPSARGSGRMPTGRNTPRIKLAMLLILLGLPGVAVGLIWLIVAGPSPAPLLTLAASAAAIPLGCLLGRRS